MHRTFRLGVAALVVGVVAGTLTSCVPSPNADIACAWPVIANREALNVAYPDAGATYFATRYRLAPGQRLELRGAFPFARYTNFVTYGVAGNAVDSLTDRDIEPDPGSDNPFATPGASTDPAHRRYTVVVDPSATPGGDDNTVAPAASPGSIVNGTILQRIYVPDDDADVHGGVPLPELVVRNADGSTVPVPACADQRPDPTVTDLLNLFGPATDQPAYDPPRVNRPASVGGLFANPDNVYVAAVLAHQPGRVVVVRGRAPSFPDTRAGDSPTEATQLRYWSMCMNEYRKPYPVTDCATDAETTLDGGGDYTYVVSTAADRPTTATDEHGVTWIEWGSTQVDGLLILRHMLADPSFSESASSVAPGSPAAPTMGVYAPRVAYCERTTFDAGGAAACGL